ncbi:unnamed protein product [Didymodactylos carnosus]|uniref:Uncharacterized protein n=1 Tax=Didymodactylos carnosus TaxID=1234261 RepID=A0A816B4A3_9BILA|nr:unnamed protein product [Didymodactylos carnosus]CAF4482741.1 unnamed protein product [Didymodactylos carnosus]
MDLFIPYLVTTSFIQLKTVAITVDRDLDSILDLLLNLTSVLSLTKLIIVVHFPHYISPGSAAGPILFYNCLPQLKTFIFDSAYQEQIVISPYDTLLMTTSNNLVSLTMNFCYTDDLINVLVYCSNLSYLNIQAGKSTQSVIISSNISLSKLKHFKLKCLDYGFGYDNVQTLLAMMPNLKVFELAVHYPSKIWTEGQKVKELCAKILFVTFKIDIRLWSDKNKVDEILSRFLDDDYWHHVQHFYEDENNNNYWHITANGSYY